MIRNHDIIDKCRDSLVGGAVGDALGYEAEFMSLQQIINRFWENGITEYVLLFLMSWTQMPYHSLEKAVWKMRHWRLPYSA